MAVKILTDEELAKSLAVRIDRWIENYFSSSMQFRKSLTLGEYITFKFTMELPVVYMKAFRDKVKDL